MEENKMKNMEATDKEETQLEKEEKINEQVEEKKEINEEVAQENEVEKLKKEVQDMKEIAQRTAAEFMNYKKRVAKEKQDLTTFANEKIITELLIVLDNFTRAIESEKDNETPFFTGVEMIRKQLEDTLVKNGLEELNPLGEDFDPNYHHAVMQGDGDEPNKVIEVLQKGYKLKERVIRPAMVKVSQ